MFASGALQPGEDEGDGHAEQSAGKAPRGSRHRHFHVRTEEDGGGALQPGEDEGDDQGEQGPFTGHRGSMDRGPFMSGTMKIKGKGSIDGADAGR